MNDQHKVDELLKVVNELRFALTDSLITLTRVYGYATMPPTDVTRVKESIYLAEKSLCETDNL